MGFVLFCCVKFWQLGHVSLRFGQVRHVVLCSVLAVVFSCVLFRYVALSFGSYDSVNSVWLCLVLLCFVPLGSVMLGYGS